MTYLYSFFSLFFLKTNTGTDGVVNRGITPTTNCAAVSCCDSNYCNHTESKMRLRSIINIGIALVSMIIFNLF
jgi:hypothetical protein